MKRSLYQWFSYIENLHSKTIALGLDRIQPIAKKLGVLSFPCPVVTVSGTNGKGSCVTFLEAIFTAAGYKVGTYTSPHLLRFNERIRLANKVIDDATLIDSFERVEIARAETTLTYFEFTTLAALIIFQAAKPDALILEIGLGGRLDAVNLVEPDISVITSISLDHTDLLGDTREAVGYEKAGIFRPGKPAVCGDPNPPISVLDSANTLHVPLYCAGQDFNFSLESDTASSKTWHWRSKKKNYKHLPLPLPCLPLQNAATALMVIQCLQQQLYVNATAIAQGLIMAFLPGRLQHIYAPMEVILDVAHNPAATTYLAKHLHEQPIVGKTRAVVSILSDKDIAETLRPLLPIVKTWYVADLQLSRGSTAESMANYLQELGVAAYDIHQAELIVFAFQQAMRASQMQDRILVFGSFHTVAPVLQCLMKKLSMKTAAVSNEV